MSLMKVIFEGSSYICFISKPVKYVNSFSNYTHLEMCYDAKPLHCNFIKKFLKKGVCHYEGRILTIEEKSKIFQEKFEEKDESKSYFMEMELYYHSSRYLLDSKLFDGGIYGLMKVMEDEIRADIMVRKLCEEYLVLDMADIILSYVKKCQK